MLKLSQKEVVKDASKNHQLDRLNQRRLQRVSDSQNNFVHADTQ